MARARFLARRRRSRHRIAGAPGRAAARRNNRVITRTASHNSLLSLGSCISAALTVLSRRTAAPLSSRSCLALTSSAWLTASQVSANRADRLVQYRLLWRPPQGQAGKGAKRGRILEVKGQLFVTKLALLLEQRTAQHALRWQSSPPGFAHPLPAQISCHLADQRQLAIQPLRHRPQLAADLVLGKYLEYSCLDGAFLTHCRLRR